MEIYNLPVIILVEPQLAINVGMIARVMLNFSFNELRLINPRDKDIIKNALASSAGADSILINSKIYNKVSDAVADLNVVYASTQRVRYLDKPINNLNTAFNNINNFNIRIGFLFGRESSGLSNNDLGYANTLIKIETNPNFSSLSIVQAVALLCYEWINYYKLHFNNQKYILQRNLISELANFNDLEYFFKFIENSLSTKEQFLGNKLHNILSNFRNIFLRAQLTKKEIRTLYRIIKGVKNSSK